MIQELLGGPGFNNIGGERKFSITETILQGIPSPSLQSSSSSSSSLSSSSTTTAAAAAAANNSSSNSDNNLQNLRCPRCDSSNTKFCYYNNYNLTQPRHFCKTCRRYWTKGGALRNVPIGGGCRKNKSSSGSIVSNSVGKSSTTTTANKMKTVVGYEIAGRSNLGNGFDHHHHHHLHQLPTSPVMWASPQNSQLLATLRATQQNNHVKEEGGLGLINGTPLMATDQSSSRTMVLDPLINNNNLVPSSLGLCSSLWKNNHHHQAQQYQQQQNGILVGHEVQNSGIQELYQRLKSSTTTNNNYYSDHQHHHQASTIVHGNATCSASSTSTILESAPVAGGDHQLGYWNPALSWSDLQTTTNGAYP